MKQRIHVPTDIEDAEITAAALDDPDAQPISDDDWARFRDANGRLLDPLAFAKVELKSAELRVGQSDGPGQDVN